MVLFEVRSSATINQLDRPHKSLRSVEQTVTVLVVENSVGRRKINVRAESPLIPGSNFLFPGDLQGELRRNESVHGV